MSASLATKRWARWGIVRGFAALHAARLYRPTATPVAFVHEHADWQARRTAEYYVDGLALRHPGLATAIDRPWGLFDCVVHFSSQFHWQSWAAALPHNNRYVVSYFHGKPEDGPEMARHVDFVLANHARIDRIVTAAGLVERRLRAWGLPADKLRIVPLGVDDSLFRPPSPDERRAARLALGIPEGAVVVGSFQKDGVGWGEGTEPKLVKGPDVFVQALRLLKQDFPVFAFLTGPARGYVKQGLDQAGIAHRHLFLENHSDVARCYRALDLYFVTSREEGGPQALLESLASAVPVVSTRVGMAEDVILDGENGALVDVGDAASVARRAAEILSRPEMATTWRHAGRATAERYRWSIVADMLYDQVYKDLLS